jgi:hypothetical protein
MTTIQIDRDGRVNNPERIVEGATVEIGRRKSNHRVVNYILSTLNMFYEEFPMELGDLISVQDRSGDYMVYQIMPTGYHHLGVLRQVQKYRVRQTPAMNGAHMTIGGRYIGA